MKWFLKGSDVKYPYMIFDVLIQANFGAGAALLGEDKT